MIWIDQPTGTGFSRGRLYERNQVQVSRNMLGFLKNFQDAFSFHNKSIYITGQSYAGVYIPYIADAMFNANDKRYFDLKGTMLVKYVDQVPI